MALYVEPWKPGEKRQVAVGLAIALAASSLVGWLAYLAAIYIINQGA